MAIDAYRTLGLEPGASAAEVKRAYRQLAKALHPDTAGPAALPRFLAIHAAYEQLTNGKRAVRGVRGAPPTARPAEPWQADPSRARAAREQARARGRPAGSGAGGGTRTSASGAGAASGPGSAGAKTGSTRRRSSRKATMGSTSYDEARDPADTTWGGASWYGPTSGEYWRVNPREYADPRKHGPEYQSRARRQSTTTGEAWDAGSVNGSAPPEPPPSREREPMSGAGPDSDGGRPGPSAASRDTAERAWAPPPPRSRREPAPALDDEDLAAPWSSLARFLEREPRDPIRRLGLSLLAWAPIGLAVAALIGSTTGCTAYSATCTGLAPLLPWLAQAVILGLLMLLPGLARILAIGTLAVVIALVPVTGLLIAMGGGGEPSAPAALEVLLAVVWAVGVGLGLRGAARVRHRAAAP